MGKDRPGEKLYDALISILGAHGEICTIILANVDRLVQKGTQQHSQDFQHTYEASFHLLDVDMSGMPCGPKAAFATTGYEASQYQGFAASKSRKSEEQIG